MTEIIDAYLVIGKICSTLTTTKIPDLLARTGIIKDDLDASIELGQCDADPIYMLLDMSDRLDNAIYTICSDLDNAYAIAKTIEDYLNTLIEQGGTHESHSRPL